LLLLGLILGEDGDQVARNRGIQLEVLGELLQVVELDRLGLSGQRPLSLGEA
jgi:hypothetical protein